MTNLFPDIIQINTDLKTKKYSSVELTKDCIKRIKQLDNKINCFVTLDEEGALKQAQEADNLLKTTGERNLITGIPIAVKDNYCTNGLTTTASSNVLRDYVPPFDATVVNKLRKAGAVIIGKTNMDAWAHGSSTETSDFFTTKNPWDLNRVAGGSSGGSAAAVSANLTPIAIGSETAGSIRQPSSWCGTTGFKPTYGAVSRFGLIAMASSTDSPGPIANSAKDCEIIYNIIKGKDDRDATSHDFDLNSPAKEKGIIGLPKEYFLKEMEPDYLKSVQNAVGVFEKMGYQIKEISLLDPSYSISVYTIVQRSEVSSNLGRFDGIRYGNDRKSFGKEAIRRIMLGAYALSSGYYDAYYLKAQKVRTLICDDFKKVFEEVDFIVAPTTPTVALEIGATDNSFMFGELQDVLLEPSSLAGLPAINIPCGFSEKNLPFGMQIIGPQQNDYEILNLADKFQSATNWHNQHPEI